MRSSRRLVLIAAASACASPHPVVPTPVAPAAASHVSVDSVLASLTLREKIGQIIVPWLSGAYSASDDSVFREAQRWVDSLQVGGLIISVGGPFDIAAKLNALQTRSRISLLVSADLEWGAAMRVVGAAGFPQIMAAGATGNQHDAFTIGAAAAYEGRTVGIHVNFAPDADLNNNPLHPIINNPSFREEPQATRAVGALVQAYGRGLPSQGMLATLKHFPGHGNTETDSHIGMPVITAGYVRLDSLELVRFRAGIDAAADIVMSAHTAFPALTRDSDPATLSPAVLTGMLRDSLHFGGLVVTDALTMGADVGKDQARGAAGG